MKGFETTQRDGGDLVALPAEHCPAMKGFETNHGDQQHDGVHGAAEHCPAMKGFET